MGIDSLKQFSDEIRSLSAGKSRIHWPEDFKTRVIKELSQGRSGRDVSKATGHFLFHDHELEVIPQI